jgi:glycosyltransferase involved in cell wall biosynthesis
MSKPLRICFILSTLYLSGGVRVVIQYANHLVKRGHQISLVIPNGTISNDIRQEIDVNVKIIQAKNTIEKSMNLAKLLCLAWDMAKVVPQSEFIFATHTPTTAVSFIAGRLFKRGKILWFYQDYLEMYGGHPIESWLLRNALRWHDFALTVSDTCVHELRSFSQGMVIKVGEGIDSVNIFHPIPTAKSDYHGDPQNKVVYFIGDSRPRKGMTDILIAAEKLIELETNIVLWISTKEDINFRSNVPYKLFIRPTDHELACLYSACDVFVSASWYEGFGLPPLEAMACGAAVVTTDSRGIREYAVNGDNCLIVPPRDPEALAEAILLLLSNSELADQVRKNGLTTASKFNWDIATDRFEAALNSSHK